jgi:hypothetical protein
VERVDDATIAELRKTIDTHRDGRASQALEALAVIADDRALRHVQAFAHRKGKLTKRAGQMLEEAARLRGVTLDELEDQLVPELGLDAGGSLTIEYGCTRFTVGFDEHLEPFVHGERGDRIGVIPRAGPGDDPAKATEAAEVWKSLREAMRSIGPQQTKRLETAMCAARPWTASAFMRGLIGHDVLGHLARRLVYQVEPSGSTFRVGEDGACTDSSDHIAPLDPDARVHIVHPAMLDAGELARWRQVFVDHEIVQPFAQLERELVLMTPDELRSPSTQRYAGWSVTSLRFASLVELGWTLGLHSQPLKELGCARRATLTLSPPIDFMYTLPDVPHELGQLTLSGPHHLQRPTFGALGAIERAELLRDIELLRR